MGAVLEDGAVAITLGLTLGTSRRSIVLLSSVDCVVGRTDVFRVSE